MPLNILMVRFSSIGDLLLTTPLIRAIRVRHPDARITFVVREDMADTIRSNRRIDEVITWRHGTPMTDLANRLRAGNWTHRLDLHCSLRTMQLRRMVGGKWRGYPKHRLRRRLMVLTRGRIGGRLRPVAERYFAAARDLDVRPDREPPEFFPRPTAGAKAAAFLEQQHLGRDRPLVVLAPGAAHFTKRWPEARWLELAARLSLDRDIVVLGGKAEEPIGLRIVDAAKGHARSAAGRFSHEINAAILKKAELVVVGDTGLLHLATAVGTPVVALYGPTVEAFGFFPYNAPAAIVQHDLKCRPCSLQGGAECPLGHHNCLVGVSVDEVMGRIPQLQSR